MGRQGFAFASFEKNTEDLFHGSPFAEEPPRAQTVTPMTFLSTTSTPETDVRARWQQTQHRARRGQITAMQGMRTIATAGATAVGRGLIWMEEPDGIPSIRTMFK